MRTFPLVIWLISVSFLLFQLFLQLSSGIIVGIIMKNMHLSGFVAGLLGSALYVVYTAMQIPVGALFDSKSTRNLLTLNILLCSVGCLVFARSHDLPSLFAGRMLIGIGASFAFVGLTHVLRQYFALKRFAFMIGLSETLCFCVSVLGIISLGLWLQHWGWRRFMANIGYLGCLLTMACWILIPKQAPTSPTGQQQLAQLLRIIRNRTAWYNGLFVGLCFAVVTVFGAMWAAPFLQLKLHCNIESASFLTAMFFLGIGVSCPLFGSLSAVLRHRRPLMCASSLATTGWLVVVIYLPVQNITLMTCCMFCIGLSCGAYMLSYSIANELAPAGASSTCTGFTNTLAVLTAPILQPLIGLLLDIANPGKQYTVHDYQIALLVMPLCTLVASVLVYWLPEKS